jgi:hypothetical protein
LIFVVLFVVGFLLFLCVCVCGTNPIYSSYETYMNVTCLENATLLVC